MSNVTREEYEGLHVLLNELQHALNDIRAELDTPSAGIVSEEIARERARWAAVLARPVKPHPVRIIRRPSLLRRMFARLLGR